TTADRMEGEVTLHLAGTDLVRVQSENLQEGGPGAAAPRRARAQEPWRTFRYGHSGPPGPLPRLALHGRPPAADRPAAAGAARSHLTTYLEPSGRLLHHYRFRVWNWRQRTLPLLLPAGVRPLAAKADGQWVSGLAPAETPDGTVVELPVTAG